MDRLWLDLRFSLRLLVRAPAFTLAVVAILALGIGANTAMFSVVNAVLLRPLPYPHAERLVALWAVEPNFAHNILPGSDYLDWAREARSFEALCAGTAEMFNLAAGGEAPESVVGARVSAGFFDVMGVRPARGRALAPDDDRPGAPRAVVVSDRLWRTRFGADPGLVGRTVRLDGEVHTVVGVMPPGFDYNPAFNTHADAWTPLAMDAAEAERRGGRSNHWLYAVGRLHPWASPATAERELTAIARGLEARYPATNRDRRALVVPLREEIVGEVRPALLMLLAAIGLVLLVVCANVANLLLARAAARQPELALRVALGASRGRLVRQLLTESVLLALLGGALGVLASLWATDLLAASLADPRVQSIPVRVDARALAFALGVSLATGVAFGTAPAVAAARVSVQALLKQGAARATGGRGHGRVRAALVVGEVAVAFALLAGAGLLLGSLARLSRVDPGFDPRGVLAARLELPAARYGETAQIASFYRELVRRLGALPGVTAAGAVDFVPFNGEHNNHYVQVEGRAPWPMGQGPILERHVASPGYFRAMGLALRQGRWLTDADTAQSRPVMLLGERAARRLFPAGDALGHRIDWGASGVWREVVGVVSDVRRFALDRDVTLDCYLPLEQAPRRRMAVVVRGGGDDPSGLGRAVAATVAALDAEQPVFDTQTMPQRIERSLGARRFSAVLLGLFAAAALVLAATGIFAVVAFQTAQRTREIGIRVALGARPGAVVRLVVAQAARLIALGLLLGVPLAVAAGRAVAGLLYGVGATEPAVLAAVAALLALVGLSAAVVPAARALRISPAAALRND